MASGGCSGDEPQAGGRGGRRATKRIGAAHNNHTLLSFMIKPHSSTIDPQDGTHLCKPSPPNNAGNSAPEDAEQNSEPRKGFQGNSDAIVPEMVKANFEAEDQVGCVTKGSTELHPEANCNSPFESVDRIKIRNPDGNENDAVMEPQTGFARDGSNELDLGRIESGSVGLLLDISDELHLKASVAVMDSTTGPIQCLELIEVIVDKAETLPRRGRSRKKSTSTSKTSGQFQTEENEICPDKSPKEPREEKETNHCRNLRSSQGSGGNGVAASSDFFLPVSKKRSRKKSLSSNVQENGPFKSGKNGKSSTIKDEGVIVKDFLDFDHELWREARLAAEENARLSAGKPTHPFFLKHKISSTTISTTGSEQIASQANSIGEPRVLSPCPPLHVTQACIDYPSTAEELKWRESASGALEKESHLRLTSESRSCGVGDLQLVDRCSAQAYFNSLLSIEYSSEQGLMELSDYLKVSESCEADFCKSWPLESLKKQLFAYAVREVRSCCDSNSAPGETSNDMQNALWTDGYQPGSADQVCGNKCSVKFLDDWLHDWREKIISEKKQGDPCFTDDLSKPLRDDDWGWFEDDSDESSINEENVLHNTLLITGPVGCGKSAAIYACAREQGFVVIEINTSDVRSGALLKHKFGEAFESHGLTKWSSEDRNKADINDMKNGGAAKKTALPDKKGIKKQKKEPKQTKQQLDTGLPQCGSENFKGKMTLILFEDVDTIFEEDRGFMSAVVQLARTTKRPIILTSNRSKPRLPHMQTLHLEFSRPSIPELVKHGSMVCISKGVPQSPWIIECIVKDCQQDLRKLMTFLQFWGQGLSSGSHKHGTNNSGIGATSKASCMLTDSAHLYFGEYCAAEQQASSAMSIPHQNIPNSSKYTRMHNSKEALSNTWPVNAQWLLESDVHYYIMPHLLPISFPCHLSEIIAERITRSAEELRHMEEMRVAQSVKLKYDAIEDARKLLKKCKRTSKFAGSQEDSIYESSPGTASPYARKRCRSVKQRTAFLFDSDDEAICEGSEIRNAVDISKCQGNFKLSDIEGCADMSTHNFGDEPSKNESGFRRLRRLNMDISSPNGPLTPEKSQSRSFVQEDEKHKICTPDRRLFVTSKNSASPMFDDAIYSSPQACLDKCSSPFSRGSSPHVQGHITDDIGCRANDSPLKIDITHTADLFDSVSKEWSLLRDSKEELKLKCSPSCISASEVLLNLAKLENNVSACDLLSLDDHIELEEISAQLAYGSQLFFVRQCQSALFPSGSESLQMDSPTKHCVEVATWHAGIIRDRKCKLQQILDAARPLKSATVLHGHAFHEVTAFMARIAGLEEHRKLFHGGGKRRSREFQHHFSKLTLEEEAIEALLQHSKYGLS